MDNMTVLVPMMLFGWIPLSILSFWLLKPQHAVIFTIIGGWLFLPMAEYNLPSIPPYDKKFAIAIGLILGHILSSRRQESTIQWKIIDLPILIWCFCPVLTSLSNDLGLYDGLSATLKHIAIYGVPYLVGRLYFRTPDDLRDLCIGIMVGGIIYIPLCLWEIRTSPQLHLHIYGFFQHSFEQHIRYGGYRPIIFMQHGLMVSLWMALASVVTFWYWCKNDKKHLMGIPLLLIFSALAITTLLCKSANGWTILILGIGCYLLHDRFNATGLFKWLILIIPLYFIIRISGLVTTQDLASIASVLFDEERVNSLAFRLNQEDLISVEVLKRPIFGWGRFGRGLPVDIDTGQFLIHTRDGLWLISFQTYGIVGLLSLYASILLGPWVMLSTCKTKIKSGSNFYLTISIALSLLVIFFSIDSLFNSMVSTLYIATSAALISVSTEFYEKEQLE